MRLKSIKLAGFKSFVDPTTVPFPDAMTAIVGPNGCGKSNIIDAVRWVLGESSAKNLRGDAMTDVIFNGSTERKPVSQASVELLFDNSSGRVQGEFAKYNEIAVKRVVTRDATNNYYLNGSKCRKRDITDIFLGTGLGPRSYAIIEQGMISRLIESKPQELRVFIEEAAGISKYKERRRETENRIKHTKENLERLEDVRQELGQQIEKLQRQASAAQRFKELKAKERQYKSELCGMRWFKMTQQLQAAEQKVKEKENAIESFTAEQRGGELNLVKYKEQQAEFKARLSEIQQQYFNTGNEITRLEQNILHAKQRKQRVTEELQKLDEQYESLKQLAEQEAEQLEALKFAVEEKEPENALIEEQLEASENALEQAEQALQETQSIWDEKNTQFNQLQQSVQINRAKLQSLHDLQVKSNDRIEQLQQELEEVIDATIEEDLLSLNELAETLTEQELSCSNSLEQKQQQYHELQNKLQHSQQLEQNLKGDKQTIDAERTSLETLQNQQSAQTDRSAWLDKNQLNKSLLWQQLEVDSNWQKAIEQVLGKLLHAVILDKQPTELLDVEQQHFSALLRSNNAKKSGTLAEKVTSTLFPEYLNQIFIVENLQDATQQRASLKAGESIITPDGHWLGSDWSFHGFTEENAGVIERADRLNVLAENKQTIDATIVENAEQIEQLTQQLTEQKLAVEKNEAEKQGIAKRLAESKTQLLIKQQQLQMQQSREEKLTLEIARQKEALELELEQQETVKIELEESNELIAEMEQQREDLLQQREDQQTLVGQFRAQREATKNQHHQLALALQDLNTRQQGLLVTLARTEQQLLEITQRKTELQAEQNLTDAPLEDSAEQLEILLQQRVEIEAQQAEFADKLADVESIMADSEKGYQQILQRIQQMRSELESARLEAESFRVRASTYIEQLSEMGQSMRELMETLDTEADEQEWEQSLEKTTQAISRLGAINLAAIDEYEVQSERKEFLDTQHRDLADALETLETAIRRIDRETKAMFKETFEQVNGDLMMLFPKVFGGGSAYLELTDQDLLETGVTIMARPPGKKNSTIHLLSGGEKALTALSLVFAIFRLNPAPFCMLDEVDAPLDDANVVRFCRLVSEMSNSVQFVYISHNKISMEMANHLTGVTMHEPGVSRMVAVDIDEAVALAEM